MRRFWPLCWALTISLFVFGCATARVDIRVDQAPRPSAPASFDLDRAIAKSPFDRAVWGIRVEEDDGGNGDGDAALRIIDSIVREYAKF